MDASDASEIVVPPATIWPPGVLGRVQCQPRSITEIGPRKYLQRLAVYNNLCLGVRGKRGASDDNLGPIVGRRAVACWRTIVARGWAVVVRRRDIWAIAIDKGPVRFYVASLT